MAVVVAVVQLELLMAVMAFGVMEVMVAVGEVVHSTQYTVHSPFIRET